MTEAVWFTFEVPGDPRGKGRPRATTRGSFVKLYTDAKTASYENLVRLAARRAMGDMSPFKGAVAVIVTAYFAIPKSTAKKLIQPMLDGDIRHTKRIDIDNCAKCVLDGLNTVAFLDDAQVVSLLAEKFYADTPRVVVTVRQIHP